MGGRRAHRVGPLATDGDGIDVFLAVHRQLRAGIRTAEVHAGEAIRWFFENGLEWDEKIRLAHTYEFLVTSSRCISSYLELHHVDLIQNLPQIADIPGDAIPNTILGSLHVDGQHLLQPLDLLVGHSSAMIQKYHVIPLNQS